MTSTTPRKLERSATVAELLNKNSNPSNSTSPDDSSASQFYERLMLINDAVEKLGGGQLADDEIDLIIEAAGISEQDAILARAFLTQRRRRSNLVSLTVAQQRFGAISPELPTTETEKAKKKPRRKSRFSLHRLSSAFNIAHFGNNLLLLGDSHPHSSSNNFNDDDEVDDELDAETAQASASGRSRDGQPLHSSSLSSVDELSHNPLVKSLPPVSSFPGIRMHNESSGLVSVQLTHAERKEERARRRVKRLKSQARTLNNRISDLEFQNKDLQTQLTLSKSAVAFFQEKTGAVREDLVALHESQVAVLRQEHEAQVIALQARGEQQSFQLDKLRSKHEKLKARSAKQSADLHAALSKNAQLENEIQLLRLAAQNALQSSPPSPHLLSPDSNPSPHLLSSSPLLSASPHLSISLTSSSPRLTPQGDDLPSISLLALEHPGASESPKSQSPRHQAAAEIAPPPAPLLPPNQPTAMPSPMRTRRKDLMAEIKQANAKLTQVSSDWFQKHNAAKEDGMAASIARALMKRRLCMTESNNRPSTTPLRAALLGSRGGHFSDHDSESDWE